MAEENTNVSQSVQNDSQADVTTQANNDSSTKNESSQNDKKSSQNELSIEKAIQQAVDRATNKLGNDNKALRKELEALRKEKMTEEELRELEIKNREADIADREAKLKEKENRLFAIKAIKEAGLDDGSSNSLKLVDFVMTDSEETTTARVKDFANLVKSFVTAQVDQTFKANGRNPDKSNNGESKNINNTVVESIGVLAAERAAESDKVLGYYLGGNN